MANKMRYTDLLLFHCESTRDAACVACGRDFLLSGNSIESAWKDELGNVVFLLKTGISMRGVEGEAHSPYCPGTQPRRIHTSMSWSDFVDLADCVDCGNVHLE
jgi:hypothetical protein